MEQMLQMRCSALDGPKTLEKVYKGLGFYGRHFRGTHGKYRKLENIQRPQSRFTFSEDSFVQTSCNIYNIYTYFLESQQLKKLSTTIKWLIHVKTID